MAPKPPPDKVDRGTSPIIHRVSRSQEPPPQPPGTVDRATSPIDFSQLTPKPQILSKSIPPLTLAKSKSQGTSVPVKVDVGTVPRGRDKVEAATLAPEWVERTSRSQEFPLKRDASTMANIQGHAGLMDSVTVAQGETSQALGQIGPGEGPAGQFGLGQGYVHQQSFPQPLRAEASQPPAAVPPAAPPPSPAPGTSPGPAQPGSAVESPGKQTPVSSKTAPKEGPSPGKPGNPSKSAAAGNPTEKQPVKFGAKRVKLIAIAVFSIIFVTAGFVVIFMY